MTPQRRVPPPVARPALALWVWERKLTWKEAGDFFGLSGEAVRQACLPFDDPNRCVPRAENLERIHELTEWTVPPDSFYRSSPGANAAAPVTSSGAEAR
jgi:hypothetical protein